MRVVESFILGHDKRINNLFEKQMRERFQLVLKHSKTTPYGPKGWMRYRTLNPRNILSEIKAEEIINENLLAYRRKWRTKGTKQDRKKSSQLFDMMRAESMFEPIGYVSEEETNI